MASGPSGLAHRDSPRGQKHAAARNPAGALAERQWPLTDGYGRLVAEAGRLALAIDVSDALVELVAHRVVELLSERVTTSQPEWLNTREAAKHLCCTPGRIHDLVGLRKLIPYRDGRRLLFRRKDLDAYLEDGR